MALNNKWIYYVEDEVASTNDEIPKYCTESDKYIVVCAKKQLRRKFVFFHGF